MTIRTHALEAEASDGRYLENLSVLLSGQLITSRTETLEKYLRPRVKTLGVVGLASVYAGENVARGTVYERSARVEEFGLPNLIVRKRTWADPFFLTLAFCLYVLSMAYALIRLRRRFDLFIGVSGFSAFLGVWAKRFGFVRKVIYYSIDYYPLPAGGSSFNKLVVRAFWRMDRFCVRHTDLVWHITGRIAQGRERFGNVQPDEYKHVEAPLTYDASLLRSRSMEEIDPNAIVFVGTLSPNQGLQLVVEAMPEIARQFPNVRVEVIGKGPYEAELKQMIAACGVEKHFKFHGFIPNEEDVLDLISRCAFGIAPWTSSPDDNSLYADPGKPKLYAFCGLPVVITRGPAVAEEIEACGAGVAIDYSREAVIASLARLLAYRETLREYRRNAQRWAQRYTSEQVMGRVFRETQGLIVGSVHV